MGPLTEFNTTHSCERVFFYFALFDKQEQKQTACKKGLQVKITFDIDAIFGKHQC